MPCKRKEGCKHQKAHLAHSSLRKAGGQGWAAQALADQHEGLKVLEPLRLHVASPKLASCTHCKVYSFPFDTSTCSRPCMGFLHDNSSFVRFRRAHLGPLVLVRARHVRQQLAQQLPHQRPGAA